MILPVRLDAVLSFIDLNDVIADIGTDHGFLLKAALDKGLKFVQGVENKKGPYNRACLNLKNEIASNQCLISLSDGLNDLDELVDTAVIVGMGGELIAKIIDDNIEKAKKLKKLILGPNVRNYELRVYLSNNGFTIQNEKIVVENNKYYEIIVVKPISSNYPLTEKECLFGPCLLKEKSQNFTDKWTKKLSKYQSIINDKQDLPNIQHLIALIKEVLYGNC